MQAGSTLATSSLSRRFHLWPSELKVKLGDWTFTIAHHEEALASMPDEMVQGRNLRDGYLRGTGIQFGGIRNLCANDPVFTQAYSLARHLSSPVGDDALCNFFLLLKYYLPRLGKGHIVEFGTDRGGSALFLARVAMEYLPSTKIYCFDSFQGMPETDSALDIHRKGQFSNANAEALVKLAADCNLRNVEIVKGFFEETVPKVLPTLEPVLLAHVDCDLYQSVAQCYKGTRGFLIPEGYLVFDDPLISSCLGAFEAVAELVIRRDGRHIEQAWPHLVFRGS